jgi:polysaccharide deacetylase family protein (PEP-CTERM system associated)
VRGTFFVLGLVAEASPGLVRDIASAGHEVGTHGYSHRLVYEMGPERFRVELRRSIRLLQDLTGQPVLSHRAAEFSITPRSSWAWEILAEEGIRYDSSIFPIRHPRYGWPGAPATPYWVGGNGAGLWECPLTTLRVGKWNLPVGGGGYLRILPYAWTRRALRAVAGHGRPIVMYLHPHEFDPAPLRVREGPKHRRQRLFELLQNVNRGTVARQRTARLLDEFSPGPLQEVAQSWRKT